MIHGLMAESKTLCSFNYDVRNRGSLLATIGLSCRYISCWATQILELWEMDCLFVGALANCFTKI